MTFSYRWRHRLIFLRAGTARSRYRQTVTGCSLSPCRLNYICSSDAVLPVLASASYCITRGAALYNMVRVTAAYDIANTRDKRRYLWRRLFNVITG